MKKNLIIFLGSLFFTFTAFADHEPFPKDYDISININNNHAGYSSYLPPGNYQQTCRALNFSHYILSGVCQDRRGFSHHTELKLRANCRFIENIDGQLRCTQWDHHSHHQFHRTADVDAGPIWNQRQAEHRCPRVCDIHGADWTGNWNTIVEGRRSVCECSWR